MKTAALCIAAAIAASASLAETRIAVGRGRGREVSDYLFGVNHRYAQAGYGMCDPKTGKVKPDFLEKTKGAAGAVRCCIGEIWEHASDTSVCDGVVLHEYRIFGKGCSTKRDVYNRWIRRGENMSRNIPENCRKAIAKAPRKGTHAIVTEFGIIDVPAVYTDASDPLKRDEARMLGRALHFATILVGCVEENPSVSLGSDGKCPALRVLAAKKAGKTVLLVINRDPENAVAAALAGVMLPAAVKAKVLTAADFAACNTPEHPDDVRISDVEMKPSSGTLSFATHSITVVEL